MRSTYNFLALCIILLSGCYSFKGISIPAGINTYYVEDFTLQSSDAPGDLNQRFSEALRQKIREESRLSYEESQPDIVFEGTVTKYNIKYIAPEEGNTTSLSRLEIGVRIEYINESNPDDSWSRNYSDFEDYDSNQNFEEIRDGLIEIIIEDIMERIFNDAFTNW